MNTTSNLEYAAFLGRKAAGAKARGDSATEEYHIKTLRELQSFVGDESIMGLAMRDELQETFSKSYHAQIGA